MNTNKRRVSRQCSRESFLFIFFLFRLVYGVLLVLLYDDKYGVNRERVHQNLRLSWRILTAIELLIALLILRASDVDPPPSTRCPSCTPYYYNKVLTGIYTGANGLEIIIYALHNVNSPSSFKGPGHYRDYPRTTCGNIIFPVCLNSVFFLFFFFCFD